MINNFIKAHPYLSCTGLALATNALVIRVGHLCQSDVVHLTMPTTLSSMLITVIDQYNWK